MKNNLDLVEVKVNQSWRHYLGNEVREGVPEDIAGEDSEELRRFLA